ncbi:hypothetical protein PIB30_074848, partial [Stylosanthes scabra]|nr:hypothetical protein [Stylosanthes scabra]
MAPLTLAMHVPLSSETDKIALLALKDKLTNGDPHALPSWNHSLYLKRLQLLNLSQNNLHGQIPTKMINCSRLMAIKLLYNNLTGRVPSWFGSMIQLTNLLLGVNHFVGSIPASLGNLSSLQELSFAYNHLEGSVTPALGRLSNLEFLSLGINNFSGHIPPSLYNLSNIQFLTITENQLEGTLLMNIPMAFPNLLALQCGMNRFIGTFPSSISNLSKLQVFGSGRADDLDFLSSLENCTQMQKLAIESNYLGGVLTELKANLSSNLVMLTMGSNQISGRIPEGIGKLINLELLSMEGNSLEGEIPYSIGKLKNLVQLTLEGNKLFGNIPLVIGSLTMLSKVDLSNNKFEGFIPFTLGNCNKMERFYGNNNCLSGNIPTQIFSYQQSLIVLSLYSNSFTGPIPFDLGNLNYLSTLNLEGNNLMGEIPIGLSACSALTELALGTNLFHGSISSFLGSLLSFEILDLFNNNFSSTIPHELANLTLLNTLNLSFNNLYGEVPIRGVFKNITAISLNGNKHLCGVIPQLNLPPYPALPLQKKHKRSIKKRVVLAIAFGGGTLVHFERPNAVKVLNLETHGALKSLLVECGALGKIKHRNLLSILTCCSSVDYKGNDFKAIVFDFMSNGSLETLLHNILKIAREAIVHYDVKPSNVLLDDDMVDFGLARLVHGAASRSRSGQASSSAIKRTIGYIPP